MGNALSDPSQEAKGSVAAPSKSTESASASCSLRSDAIKTLEAFGIKDCSNFPSILKLPQCSPPSGKPYHFFSMLDSDNNNNSNGSTGSSSPESTGSWNPYGVLSETLGLQSYASNKPEAGNAVTTAASQSFMNAMSTYVNDLIEHNFMAIALGATVGAAVAAGAAVGLLASVSLLHAGTNYVVLPVVSQWTAFAAQRRRKKQQQLAQHLVSAMSSDSETQQQQQEQEQPQPTHHQQQSAGEEQDLGREGSDDEVKVVQLINNGTDGIWVIKGSVRPQHSVSQSSSLEQCRECLESIALSLHQHQMVFRNIRRWTVYLTDRCSKSDFVGALQSDYPQINLNQTMVSYLFVQRLENEHAVVQVEVMASSSASSSSSSSSPPPSTPNE